MKKFRLSSIIDRILLITVGFAILFVWLRFFIENIYIVLLLCSTIVLGVYLLASFIFQKSNNKKTLNKAEKNEIEQYGADLMFMEKQKCLQFFCELLQKKCSATIKKDYVVVDKTLLFSFMHLEKLTINNLSHAYSCAVSAGMDKIIICSQSAPADILALGRNIQNIKITILDKSGVYFNLLKAYDTYPPKTITLSHKKMTFKNIIEFSFSRNKFKQYMFSGLIILFCSLFMRYNIYYVVMSTVLFGLSAICLFKRPQKSTQNIFISE